MVGRTRDVRDYRARARIAIEVVEYSTRIRRRGKAVRRRRGTAVRRRRGTAVQRRRGTARSTSPLVQKGYLPVTLT